MNQFLVLEGLKLFLKVSSTTVLYTALEKDYNVHVHIMT